MKLNMVIFSMLVFIMVNACKPAKMAVSPELKSESIEMTVTGRQGWLNNRQLSFGEYASNQVRKGWVDGYQIPFLVDLQGAGQKYSYILFDKLGQSAVIFAAGKLREAEMRNIGVAITYKNTFSGSIYLKNNLQTWNYKIWNPEEATIGNKTHGQLYNGNEIIELRPVKDLENQKSLGMDPIGYEFVKDGKVLGAVETINAGRVWLKNNLPGETKMLLSAMASALLLRQNLADNVPN